MTTYIDHKCSCCGKKFQKPLFIHNAAIKRKDQNTFCSIECQSKFRHKRTTKPCAQCGMIVSRTPSEARKVSNFFCSKSCAAKYNNAHKKSGTRRSKLEVFIEEQLNTMFPDIRFLYNDRKAIKSELDIYLPDYRLAFELNGIFHYEPIYGKEKLASIQDNDQRKMQACLEHGIELCIIDSSEFKYFKASKAKKYLNIIESIIRQKLSQV